MKIRTLILIASILGSCSKSDVSELVGTWDLISVNGQTVQSGVLRWVFTETTVTVTSNLDCKEVIEYEAKGGVLTGISVISQDGTQCGVSEDSLGEMGKYTLDGNSLSVTVTDPAMNPSTAIFVFRKVR